MKKRIFAFLFVIILVIQMFPFAISAESAGSGILGELAGATVGGEAFDIEDYPKKNGASAELLAFMECGYAYNGDQSNYAMIVYVYNPS